MKSFDELTFTDDFMFSKVMQDEYICKGVIERLLKIRVKSVKHHVSQYSINSSPESHGVRLDVYVEDDNRVFDLEIQTYPQKALEKRMRYYQAAIDIDHLNKGAKYKELPDSYIVFICLEDPFDSKLPVYSVRQIIEEKSDSIYNDGTHKVMFNASAYENVEDNELHDFLKFLYTKSSSSEFTDEIERLVNESKGNEKWRVEYMNVQLWLDDAKDAAREEGLSEGRAKGIAEGRAEGLEKGRVEGLEKGRVEGLEKGRAEGRKTGLVEGALGKEIQIIKNMLAQNFTLDMITKCTGVPEERVREIAGNSQ